MNPRSTSDPSFAARLRAVLFGSRQRIVAWLGSAAVAAALGVLAITGLARSERGAGGVVLAAESQDQDPPLDVEGFLALERRLAEERQSRAQAMLDRLWPGRAFVTVGVERDPRWTTSAERIQPDSPALVSDERPDGGAGGRRRAYEPFSGERETRLIAPELRRVSAALVLDSTIARDGTQQRRIVDAVKKAIGPVQGQDPDVEVLVESFPQASVVKPARRASPLVDHTADLAVFLGSVAIAALGVAWFWIRRAKRRRAVIAEPVAPAPASSPPAETPRGRRSAIEDSIQKDPVFASRLVESWMAEGRT
ncbi:MAG: hypothetical protein HZB39_15190 [Planctomycetes bacterium]|nr:hypothetical protein [Planctomycetota bacterium]